MIEKLDEVNSLIDNASNIPLDIKPIVKAVCRGYMRESKGLLPLEGINNVCNATFVRIAEDDDLFRGENKIMGETKTDYDEECHVKHIMSYINDSDYLRLVTILTHELGHVMTEYAPCSINNGIYPIAKRTTAFYLSCYYDKDNCLYAKNIFGVKMSDGFLESISTKIFASREFREELLEAGYDLGDYVYKDERLFPSRVYDDYKACFELFDYIMDGTLTDFSLRNFSSNLDLVKYINDNRLSLIFSYLDKSNDALWSLKKFERKDYSEEYKELLDDYKEKKSFSLTLASELATIYGKNENDSKYQELTDTYRNTLHKQVLLPGFSSDQSKKM